MSLATENDNYATLVPASVAELVNEVYEAIKAGNVSIATAF